MSIEARVFDALRSLVADRVYPMAAPANTQGPYIVFDLITSTSGYTLTTVEGIDRCLVQVDLWDDAAKPLSAFIALALQVRRALEAAGGRLQSEGREKDPDEPLYRARLDFVFWHRPA